MVTEGVSRQPTRAVVVAINATGSCSETLDTAALLAASEGADLEVVFVQDANLLRLADLPVTREVDRNSGQIRDIDSRRVLRTLEAEARRLRQEITHIGQARAVRSTLRIARGQVFTEALSASARVDVTFLHAAARAFAGGHLAVHGRRLGSTAPGRGAAHIARRKPVWILFEGGPEGTRALETAAKLANALGGVLTVLIPYREAAEAEKHAREVSARIGDAQLRFLEVTENRSPLEPHSLELRKCRLLVLAAHGPSLEDAVTRRYLESLQVPLVLVA